MGEGAARRLRDEIAMVEASLADARLEAERGELDDESLSAIEARDRARLAELQAQLGATAEPTGQPAGALPDPPRPEEDVSGGTSRRRRLWVVAAGGVVLAAAVLAVVLIAAPRGPGQSATGSVTPTQATKIDQLLSQAASLVQSGKVGEALPLYHQVLTIDPNQPEALAQSGWLTFEAGSAASSSALMARGEAEVRAAVSADPGLFAGHLYLGVIELMGEGNPSAALGEFTKFLALKPPAYWVGVAQPYMARAASEAGVAVPTTAP